ncbi:MAG: addB [Firmicutes bacterium]|nr:addB [Bacillota bacterium]
MSLQLFLGSAGSGKSHQLYHDIIEESRRSQETNYLVIVPEQFTLQTQKDIVTMHPEHGVMNVDILSFLRFAYRIFDEVGGYNAPVLEDTGKSMVLRKVVSEKRKELILFGSNVKKPGFIGELKSVLSELYQYNIQPRDFEKLQEISLKKPVLQAKLKDLLTIYEGFRDFMKERYITAEELLVVLEEAMDYSEWIKDTVICLDGFTGFTPCQYQVLRKMLRYAKKVLITVTIDPSEELKNGIEEHQLFGLSKKTIQKLYRLAQEEQITIEEPVYAENRNQMGIPYRFLNSPALASLEHNLFRFPYQSFDQEQQDITVHVTKDTEAEIDFVAREIKRLVREEGYRYYDIAVVSGNVEEYGRIAKRSFALAGIPCFVDYKKDILNNPFVELLRSAITIVGEDYSYEGIFRFLRTGLTDIAEQDIDILENYILATGIRGHKRWKEPFTRSYRSKEPVDLDLINALRASLVEVIEPLYDTLKDKEKTLRDYTTALFDLGVRLNIEQKLEDYRLRFVSLNQPLIAKEFEQVYKIIMDLYDQMVLLLGSEQCGLKEFGEILDTGFVEVKVGLIPPGVDEVVVGDTERTRLKDIKALFFIGVNEGIIPKAIGSGGILSDIERELLINNEIELAPTKRQQAFTEQFYIYLNMTKPKNKLFITYHKVTDEGKSANPSFLIGKLKQLFPLLIVVDEDEDSEETDNILRDEGLAYLVQGLRKYHQRETTDQWKELFLYYRSEDEREKILRKLIQGAFYVNKESGISGEAARLLYGMELKGSVTRLERYAGCAFAHFMNYGLSLQERREYKLAIPDIGNIFHNAIDDFSKRLDGGQYTWHTIPDEVREEWAVESVRKAVEDYENSFLRSTKRNEYLITRMERITVRTLWALCNQIKQGAFEPAGYEMPFYHIPDSALTLQGRIDRLDLYEEENRVYVRVIDYKSGNTFFDIQSVYYGLQQQLSVYLSAAMDYLLKQYPGKEIVPSGIFYYHIEDPIVAKSDQVEEEIYKSLRMNGLVNADSKVIALMDQKLAGPDGTLRPSAKSEIIPIETNKEGGLAKRSSAADRAQMEAFVDYVNTKLVEDSGKILSGDTKLNPYRSDKKVACEYCEYRSACGFDSRLPGHEYRNLAKKSLEEMKAEIFGER